MATRTRLTLLVEWRELGTGEGDEGGDTGGEDDEEQTDDHLIGGFWIVLMESNSSAVELALPVFAKRSPNRTGKFPSIRLSR